MKKPNRLWLSLFSLCLVILLTFSALAEGPLQAVYRAGANLLLDTDNVTLTGHAVFTYDGKQFKTMDGRYLQDGTNSVMDVTLTTPLALGGSRTGGYKVIAQGDTVYGSHFGEDASFGPQPKSASATVLSNKAITQLITALGGTVVHLAESGLADHIATSADGANTVYRLQLDGAQTPALFNKALSMVAEGMISEYFRYHVYRRPLPIITVDDRRQLIATFYEEMYGKKPTESVMHATLESNPTDYLRYEKARQAMFDYLEEIKSTSPYSAVAIRAADKHQTAYASYNDYLLSRGQQFLQFEDFSPLVNLYAQQHPNSADPAADMRAHYKQILTKNNCAGMLIEGDGDYILCYTDEELSLLTPSEPSETQRICSQTKEFSLHSADVTATLDDEGRLISFTGQLSLNTTDVFGRAHVLTINFDCAATDYDKTQIEASDFHYEQSGNG